MVWCVSNCYILDKCLENWNKKNWNFVVNKFREEEGRGVF